MKTGSPDVPILNPNRGQDCELARPVHQQKNSNAGGNVTKTTLGIPSITEAGYCGVYPDTSGGLL